MVKKKYFEDSSSSDSHSNPKHIKKKLYSLWKDQNLSKNSLKEKPHKQENNDLRTFYEIIKQYIRCIKPKNARKGMPLDLFDRNMLSIETKDDLYYYIYFILFKIHHKKNPKWRTARQKKLYKWTLPKCKNSDYYYLLIVKELLEKYY